jgi:hypothetical protein
MIWILLACGLETTGAHGKFSDDSSSSDSSTTDSAQTTQDTDEDLGEAPGSIVLTELMIDPKVVDDSFGEWLELLNIGDLPVDLRGLVLDDGTHDGYTIPESFRVEPSSRVVLAASTPDLNGGVQSQLLYDRNAFSLDNEGATLQLLWGDQLVDSLSYDASFSLHKGYSLGLSSDPHNSAAMWCSEATLLTSGDHGTPGAAFGSCEDDFDGDHFGKDDCNDEDPTVFPGAPEVEDDGVDQDCDGLVDERLPQKGDLIFTEIMFDANPVSDPEGEWVELQNVGKVPLLVESLSLDDGTTEATIPGGTILLPGKILVLGTTNDGALNGGLSPDLLYDGTLVQLNDSGESLKLRNKTDVIDEVDFSKSSFPHPSGESISLDPKSYDEKSNDDGKSWCKAKAAYGSSGLKGTPGVENPGC